MCNKNYGNLLADSGLKPISDSENKTGTLLSSIFTRLVKLLVFQFENCSSLQF